MSTLKIYMKSGNVITLKRITEWKVKSERTVVSLEITRKKYGQERLIMNSLDLSQVEAITETKGWFEE